VSGWVDVDPVAVSAYCADKADRLRDHDQVSRDQAGPTWALYLVLGDSDLVYTVTLRLHTDRWTARCDHPTILRRRQDLPIPATQCSHITAAASAEAAHRHIHIPVPPASTPPPQRPAGALAGFYD
jgi:hypothetical protein